MSQPMAREKGTQGRRYQEKRTPEGKKAGTSEQEQKKKEGLVRMEKSRAQKSRPKENRKKRQKMGRDPKESSTTRGGGKTTIRREGLRTLKRRGGK